MSLRLPGVLHEHAVLCRQMGGVQDRVSKLVQEKDMALRTLVGEVLRLRAQLVIARTCLLWGMSLPTACTAQRTTTSGPVQLQAGPSPGMESARKAICRTGCTGHAHPWLTDEGQCRWSGRACDGSGE